MVIGSSRGLAKTSWSCTRSSIPPLPLHASSQTGEFGDEILGESQSSNHPDNVTMPVLEDQSMYVPAKYMLKLGATKGLNP